MQSADFYLQVISGHKLSKASRSASCRTGSSFPGATPIGGAGDAPGPHCSFTIPVVDLIER